MGLGTRWPLNPCGASTNLLLVRQQQWNDSEMSAVWSLAVGITNHISKWENAKNGKIRAGKARRNPSPFRVLRPKTHGKYYFFQKSKKNLSEVKLQRKATWKYNSSFFLNYNIKFKMLL